MTGVRTAPAVTAARDRHGLRVTPGRPTPLGATVLADGVNFAVTSTTATGMVLVLLHPDNGDVLAELPFPDEYRIGEVYTMTVRGLDPARTHYALRASGPARPDVDRDALLLDPYAPLLAGADTWGAPKRYRSMVEAAVDAEFDWRSDRPPRIPATDLVIYELHVRGFTRHPSSAVTAPGTFAGLREKIPYLRRLGVNCVELMPIFEFDETDNARHDPATGGPLLNVWGYQPLALFAPKAAYAAAGDPRAASRELKELIRDLHAAGIEVLLDVVVNHTGEGGDRGRTLSLRGLDETTYYMINEDGRHLNFSGAGNTLNANHPVVRALIRDCLRHWVTEYHVDGFRFDLASILTRGTNGAPLDNPPLLEELAHDPVLAERKLIAEPWDAAGLYQVGGFPAYGRWLEWNGSYRDTLRRFLIGRPDGAGQFAARLVGSPDLYSGRGPAASVNFVTCHDGFTLADWASYDRKHNDRNGEDGRDGHDGNESWNCGVEGPTDDPAVSALRRRQVRNALLLLLTSHGVPMLLAGDEFFRTQGGNNNAYAHDDETTWVDWGLAESNADLVEFVARCIAFRAAHPVLRRAVHPSGEAVPGWKYPPVSWHGVRAGEPDWSPDASLLAVLLYQPTDAVFVAANRAAGPCQVRLPEAPEGHRWHLFADTGALATPPAAGARAAETRAAGARAAGAGGIGAHRVGSEPAVTTETVAVAPRSVVVLVAAPTPEPAIPRPASTPTEDNHRDFHGIPGDAGSGVHRVPRR